MQGNVYIPKITQLYHPSGELYESYRRFAEEHPDTSWFQSDAFFRFISLWPEAKPILLVALKEEVLKDPGRQYSKVLSPQTNPDATPGPKRQTSNQLTGQDPNQPRATQNPSLGQAAPNLAGSLLAVVIQNPVPRMLNFFPMAGLYKHFTSRTVVYGGPLLAEGSRLEREMTLRTLLGALRETAGKQTLFTQFRNFYDLHEYTPLFHAQGYHYHDRLNLLVDTHDKDTAWKNMSTTRRRQVRKSRHNGAEIIHNPTSAETDQFYDILKTLYRKKVRKPLPSRTFFHALNPNSDQYAVPGFKEQQHQPDHPNPHHQQSPPDHQNNNHHNPEHPTTPQASQNAERKTQNPFITILIRHQNRIIGGIACPIHRGQAMYEWYVCGLDSEYKDRHIYPSVLATWAALDYAAENGIPTFDFMGLGKPEEPYGVRDFKARFGGKWVNYGRFSRVNKRGFYAFSEIVYNLKRLLMC